MCGSEWLGFNDIFSTQVAAISCGSGGEGQQKLILAKMTILHDGLSCWFVHCD